MTDDVCDTALARNESEKLEEDARNFLQELDVRGSQECTESAMASWNYASDITEEHRKLKASTASSVVVLKCLPGLMVSFDNYLPLV